MDPTPGAAPPPTSPTAPAPGTATPRRTRPVRLALVCASLIAAAFVGARFLSRKILFPGCSVPLPAPGAELRPGVSVVEYTTDDGIALRGGWVRCGKPEAPTVVYFHGNAESAATGRPLGTELARHGFDVFLPEYRGYGGCPGSPSESGLHRDGAAALAQLRAAGVADARLFLVGRSLGTGVAVELARQGAGRALLLVSPYTSVTDIGRGIAGPIASLVVADPFDSLARIGAVKVPVVVIHGTADTLIPFELGKRLAAAAGNARLVPVEGGTHNDLDLGELLRVELGRLLAGG